MTASSLVLDRYARALHELAVAAGDVAAVGRSLSALAETIEENPELAGHLHSPQLTRDSKKRMLLGVLGDDVDDLARRTVLLLADRGRAGAVGELAHAWNHIVMETEGRQVAQVTSAVPLDDETRARLLRQLGTITGKTISLTEAVDPDLLGGVRILLGSKMIDGSLRRRLESLGESLIRAPLGAIGSVD